MIQSTRLLFFIGVVSLGIFPYSGMAQVVNNMSNQMEQYVRMGKIQITHSASFRVDGVKGSPFLFEDWVEGQVTLKKQAEEKEEEEAKSFRMNLNLFEKKLYVLLYDGTIGRLPVEYIKDLHINTPNGKIQFGFFPEVQVEGVNNSNGELLEILSDEQIIFLKHHKKSLLEAEFKGDYGAPNRFDEYKDQVTYFISSDGKDFHKIKLNRKSLEEVMPDMAEDIKRISKEKKLLLSVEKDMVDLLQMLGSQEGF